MMHRARRWGLGPVATPEELGKMLSQRTWTLCSGFYVVGHPQYLFLNDATSEDGAGEYGVVKVIDPTAWMQIESITFSWCDEAKAIDYVRRTLAGEFDGGDFCRQVDLRDRLDGEGQHGRCHLCA